MLLSQSIILGIVQGITEWLPISSSGHLVLFQKIMQLEVPVAFDVLLHLATLLAVLVFFRKDISKIIKAVLKWETKSCDFKLAIFIITAILATAIIVFPLKEIFENAFSSLLVVGIAFIITGLLLFFSEVNQKSSNINGKKAALIGLMQGVAFMPGISRSGSTISIALLLGIKREDAFKFSFLIAIPAILGASLLKIPELNASSISAPSIIAGFFSAFLLGFLSLIALKRIITNGRFHYFAYYCFAIGLITLIIHFFIQKTN